MARVPLPAHQAHVSGVWLLCGWLIFYRPSKLQRKQTRRPDQAVRSLHGSWAVGVRRSGQFQI